MYASTNSALVWKRVADESQQSAKMLTRISVGLLILMFVTGAYAYSTHDRYAELCGSISSATKSSDSVYVQKLGRDLVKAHCL